MGRKTSDCCILVAEDDAVLRYVTVTALRGCGYQVLEAADGLEALWLAAERQGGAIDLLISDLNMPRMDGNALAREMKQKRPNLLVILVSGCMADDFPPGLTNYVVDVIPKPFDTGSLVARVAALLGT